MRDAREGPVDRRPDLRYRRRPERRAGARRDGDRDPRGHGQSGDYITITGNASIGERRADDLGGPIALPSSERGPDRWFNTPAFATAPDDHRGTAGRGTVETPGLESWTISVRKRFKLAREVRMTVQLDAFNAFNHVNFRDPENTVTSSSFGQIGTAGAPRQLQLGIRLDY